MSYNLKLIGNTWSLSYGPHGPYALIFTATFCNYSTRMFSPLIIKFIMSEKHNVAPFINTTVIGREIGTRQEPYLTNISTGQKTGCSIVFHTEEDGLHFEFHRNHVTKTRLNCRCIYRKSMIDNIGR